MIKYDALMQVLSKQRGKALVVPTMTAGASWSQTSAAPSRDLPISGAMGKASSFALGLALAQPDTSVIVLDGDGSLLMNLGTMATIAGKRPKNLYHFVLNNGVYAITGGQPIAADGIIDFSEVANGAGYAATFTFDDIEDFAGRVSEVFATEGPVFVTFRMQPEVQNEPIGRRPRDPRARSTVAAIMDLRKELRTL
ncbi:MAG: thiamine pyrophosphate-binding protein [Chloroflexi bacterium]|nr:thiamine pyrophosphate-binding protein [Chloroflexota bacterium]